MVLRDVKETMPKSAIIKMTRIQNNPRLTLTRNLSKNGAVRSIFGSGDENTWEKEIRNKIQSNRTIEPSV